MFIQVVRGQVRHAEPVYVELDQWIKEISGSAEGWLGSTGGVSADKRFVGLGRWSSAEAARRQSSRPEQDHWWSAFTELFVDPPTIDETDDVVVDTPGDPDRAHFVQVMHGRGTDPAPARELIGAHRAEWAAFRPEILGTVGCFFDDAYTVAVYFTDEQAAREGERREAPPELKNEMDKLMSLNATGPEFVDLREPWLHSPA